MRGAIPITVMLGLVMLLASGFSVQAGSQMVIGKDGLFLDGRLVLHKSTPADKDTLQKLFPGFRVKISEFWGEGERYFRYSLYKGKRKFLDINPDGNFVGSIRAYAPAIVHERGIRPGDSYARLRRAGEVTCGASEEGGAEIFCEFPDEANVSFVFANSNPADPSRGEPARGDRIRYIRVFLWRED